MSTRLEQMGSTQYGSLLLIEDAADGETPPYHDVLDTTLVQYTAKTDWNFATLWCVLVNRELDIFTDESVHAEWREAMGRGKTKKPFLDRDEILGINVPVPLGAKMELSNFSRKTSLNITRAPTRFTRSRTANARSHRSRRDLDRPDRRHGAIVASNSRARSRHTAT